MYDADVSEQIETKRLLDENPATRPTLTHRRVYIAYFLASICLALNVVLLCIVGLLCLKHRYRVGDSFEHGFDSDMGRL